MGLIQHRPLRWWWAGIQSHSGWARAEAPAPSSADASAKATARCEAPHERMHECCCLNRLPALGVNAAVTREHLFIHVTPAPFCPPPCETNKLFVECLECMNNSFIWWAVTIHHARDSKRDQLHTCEGISTWWDWKKYIHFPPVEIIQAHSDGWLPVYSWGENKENHGSKTAKKESCSYFKIALLGFPGQSPLTLFRLGLNSK